MTEFIDSDGRAITAPNTSNRDTSGLTRGWRQSKWLILVELLVVILIFVADALHFIPLSKTPFLLAFGWISLRMRKLRWRDVGLSRYRSWPITLAAGVGVGLLPEAFQLFVSQPILVRVLRKQPDLELFRALHGDVKWTLLAIAGAWTLAAFGEEMVYRGYLMNRLI
jgi:membrane protease YdiL (CAAX protease family)